MTWNFNIKVLPDPESLDFERLGARLISTLALLDFEVSLPTPESVLSISKTLSRLSTEPELEYSKVLQIRLIFPRRYVLTYNASSLYYIASLTPETLVEGNVYCI